jgi:hypothetical protein
MADLRDAGTRQDTWALRLKVGTNDLGIWDKKSGGELDSDSTIYYPGGMRDQQDLGGRKTAGNITLSRLYDRDHDHPNLPILLDGVGRAKCTVSATPMDEDGNESTKRIVWNGRLKRVTPPDIDSESSAAAMIEVEIQIKGAPVLV